MDDIGQRDFEAASPEVTREHREVDRHGLVTTKRYRATDGQTLISLSFVIVGAAALGAVFDGLLRGTDITPVLITVGCGLFITSIWWAQSQQYIEAWVFGAISGFNVTYALLQLGITNRWYGIPIQDLESVVSIYVATWLFIFVVLTLALLHESKGMALFLLTINIGLAMVLASNLTSSLVLLHWSALCMAATVVASLYFIAEVVRGWWRRGRGISRPVAYMSGRHAYEPTATNLVTRAEAVPTSTVPVVQPSSGFGTPRYLLSVEGDADRFS